MIQCNNMKLVFEDRLIFDINDLTFEKGKLHLIKGENGSGKSSLFRCMIAWIKPSSGNVKVNGSWTYQPQNFHLFSPKIKDNFEVTTQVNEWFKVLNLNKQIDLHVSKLSGGERQKVALVRTLLQDTDIYLLDEPTSYMDESSKAVSYALIQEELLDKGKTVLLISHDNNDLPFKSGIVYRITNQKLFIEKVW